jgi:hypothetical protein
VHLDGPQRQRHRIELRMHEHRPLLSQPAMVAAPA